MDQDASLLKGFAPAANKALKMLNGGAQRFAFGRREWLSALISRLDRVRGKLIQVDGQAGHRLIEIDQMVAQRRQAMRERMFHAVRCNQDFIELLNGLLRMETEDLIMHGKRKGVRVPSRGVAGTN